jgi:hypothetical protein
MADAPGLQAMLKRLGLSRLVKGLTDLSERDASDAELLDWLYDQPDFRSRFPAIFNRERAGLPPLSVDEYLAYEAQVSTDARMFGMTLTKAEVDDWLSKNVSADEGRSRIEAASVAVYSSPIETREQLRRLHGVQDEDMIRFWMSPKEALPAIQAKWAQAQIAGAASRSGFGQLTLAQAQRLQGVGLTEEQAIGGFGQLASQSPLMRAIDQGEEDITQDEQVGALAGDAEALKKIERRGLRRQSMFAGGGGFATSNAGVSGLGSA